TIIVPITAFSAPKDEINKKFIIKFTIAPNITELTYSLSLDVGIKYCVLITLAHALNIIIGDMTVIKVLTGKKSSPKYTGAIVGATPPIPKEIADHKIIIYFIDFFI